MLGLLLNILRQQSCGLIISGWNEYLLRLHLFVEVVLTQQKRKNYWEIFSEWGEGDSARIKFVETGS